MVAREAPVLVTGTCRSFDFLLTPPGTGVAMLDRLLLLLWQLLLECVVERYITHSSILIPLLDVGHLRSFSWKLLGVAEAVAIRSIRIRL